VTQLTVEDEWLLQLIVYPTDKALTHWEVRTIWLLRQLHTLTASLIPMPQHLGLMLGKSYSHANTD